MKPVRDLEIFRVVGPQQQIDAVLVGRFVELVPHERLVYTDSFNDPNLPGEMQVTVTLRKAAMGTEGNIVQAGVPDVIPPEACYLGWQESLRNLARLVEPEINQ